jgi:hypothetical protein
MPDPGTRLSVFHLRIFQEISRQEAPVDRDIDVLRNRSGKDEASELAIVRGEIGSAATDRDP